MFNRKLFRDKAMERFTRPEEPEGAVQIITIKSWILLLLFMLISFTLFFWLGFRNISQTAECNGLIVKPEAITQIQALKEGFVENISVLPGSEIKEGSFLLNLIYVSDKAIINELKTAIALEKQSEIKREMTKKLAGLEEVNKLKSGIYSPADGTLFEINVSEGDYVKTGDKLLTIETSKPGGKEKQTEDQFIITGFISAKNVNSVKTGNKVLIAPHNIEVKEFGYLTGTLEKIANYPVSPERKKLLLRENQFFGDFLNDDYFEITISPVRENGKLKWTTEKGSSINFIRSAFCKIRIITESKNILSFIID